MTGLSKQDWLDAQPWYRAKFDDGAMAQTPEHNRMQARFLDNAFVMAFVKALGFDLNRMLAHRKAAVPGRIAEEEKHIAGWRKHGDTVRAERAEAFCATLRNWEWKGLADAVFEVGLIDVTVTAEIFCPPTHASETEGGWVEIVRLFVEIKPTVADEYPAVLRQMLRSKASVLFLREYRGEGATQEEFVEIFRRANKRVVFVAEVDALLAEGAAAK